ncbi:MAG: lytic transglycosylase domain-containing protein [Bdellovibrio sp.]|nr:lytic transglycosylase domain-containing protein [Bdellovibrio sp.]
MVVVTVNLVSLGLVSTSLASPVLSDSEERIRAASEATHPAYTQDGILQKSLELAEKTSNEAFKASIRWNHAKEIMGKKYHRSVVKSGEKLADIDALVLDWVKHGLRKPYKRYAKALTHTITDVSTQYGMDPLFLLAVIENESSFDTTVVGSHGEIGLMQITPDTAQWVSDRFNIPYKGKQSLKNPMVNVKLGAAYLAYLREKFENQSHLYLAAYNMGSGNVYRALAKRITPKIYPDRVMTRYLKYYTKLKAEIQRVAKEMTEAAERNQKASLMGGRHDYNVSSLF